MTAPQKPAYRPAVPPQHQTLSAMTAGTTPVLQNGSARLWDIGDGIACLELTTKMNTVNTEVFSLLDHTVDKVTQEFSGLVIGDDDRHFSAGLDLQMTLALIEQKDWPHINSLIQRGQAMVKSLKYAPFPVVAAVSGYAVGGGCETLLHCDAVQLHSNTQAGLVEQKIGVVPGWGGCKAILTHIHKTAKTPSEVTRMIKRAFTMIAGVRLSKTAKEAASMLPLPAAQITEDRAAVLPDAKRRALKLTKDYKPPSPSRLSLPSRRIANSLLTLIDERHAKGEIDKETRRMQLHLAGVLSGGILHEDIQKELSMPPLPSKGADEDISYDISEQDLFERERDSFMALIKTPAAKRRIQNILNKTTSS